ncbi:hypothetical protein J1N35_019307 [Gossypium stocksii]|uniref:Uncharacterized protein n=1 Tax=Gossypium stocksii TaxID=47602 RepID=A0A9D4A7Z9_9ROSI|nr:hypothetical protein J1N35_019307 [Gossypium stocksii]
MKSCRIMLVLTGWTTGGHGGGGKAEEGKRLSKSVILFEYLVAVDGRFLLQKDLYSSGDLLIDCCRIKLFLLVFNVMVVKVEPFMLKDLKSVGLSHPL